MNFEKPEKAEYWKNEKQIAGDIIIYTCVAKTTIILGTVPEIWGEKGFFVILGNFLSFNTLPPNNLVNQNFEKKKKASGNAIILNNKKNTIKWCMLTQI